MKILLVEDEQIITELLVEALNAQNYDVDVAQDGLEARELLKSVDSDLLLLALTIPELDGHNLCRRLRAEGYQMPVLILTARDSLQDRAAALEAGADDYVVKPYRLAELLTRIQTLLDSRKAIATVEGGRQRNISQLSSTEPDLELSPRQRLADYSESLVSDFDSEGPSSGKKIMTILGVTATLLLLGSALWCRSEFNQADKKQDPLGAHTIRKVTELRLK